MLKTTELTHLLIRHIIKEGNRVVDATAGNGHDTLFLSELADFKPLMSSSFLDTSLLNFWISASF